ncbi:putative entry exclusion protein TrbK-alt [Sphingopyxis sp. R3-92]|uniref:putative entry exclusion protein TrbK-alt n=1 Tax=Sphingopyxis sp. R3-92 TaxID=3158553 RepID=UPI003EE455BB
MAYLSSRTGRIAVIAALSGIMMAVAIMAAFADRAPAPIDAPPSPVMLEERLQREMARCATITMPDAGCEEAWAANRRRFFGRDRTKADRP